jgi:hypothetical protein
MFGEQQLGTLVSCQLRIQGNIVISHIKQVLVLDGVSRVVSCSSILQD